MLVFKFGGASVKDAEGIINLTGILQKNAHQEILVVVSAMGKTTNALEQLVKAYHNQTADVHDIYENIKNYHFSILHQLFETDDAIFDDIQNTFVEIDWMLEDEPQDDFDFLYDQIVSIGELVSTKIVNAYLNKCGVKSRWLDVRSYVHTDNTYREGVVQWDKTCEAIQKDIPNMLKSGIVVTQGFLGGTSENFTTTLGREGSDYTASIFASCLHAESVTIWKDVPGVLNADPKLFNETIKFDELSYTEAIEMTYYGATVIHPKTIKPLQNANIPLLVKPFNNPDATGTVIQGNCTNNVLNPVYIVKQNQVIITISTKDYSFVTEGHLSEIFGLFAQHQIKANMIQTSALSFTACTDYEEPRFTNLLNALSDSFKTKYNNQLTLLTVRHYKKDTLNNLIEGKEVLLEQLSRNTAQVIYR